MMRKLKVEDVLLTLGVVALILLIAYDFSNIMGFWKGN